jgi:hypothetical protein
MSNVDAHAHTTGQDHVRVRVRVVYKLNRTFLVVSGKGKLEQLVRKLHRVTDWRWPNRSGNDVGEGEQAGASGGENWNSGNTRNWTGVPEPLTASEREVSAIFRKYFHKCSLDCANQIVGE